MLKKGEVIPGSYDPIFKAIMSTYDEFLADIVSYVTDIDKSFFLENYVIKNSEYIKDNYKEKRKISDLIVEINNNMINIEMNNFYYEDLTKRNNWYLYKMINSNWNKERFIQINIDNFDKEEIINKYIMVNERTLKREEYLEKYRINLVKLEEKYYNKEELTKEEKELLMLRLKDKKALKEISKGDVLMENVNKKINDMSDDPNLQLVYDRDEFYRYEVRQAAKYEAEEECKTKYRDKLKEADEKIKTADEKIKTAKISIINNLLNKNMDIESISEITEIPIEEIKKMKDD